MYVVVVEFTAHSEYATAFRQRVQQQAQDSLKLEPDCHVFDICIDPEREEFVLLYEIYTNRAAFDRHLQSEHFKRFDRDIQNWIADKKVCTYLKVVD